MSTYSEFLRSAYVAKHRPDLLTRPIVQLASGTASLSWMSKAISSIVAITHLCVVLLAGIGSSMSAAQSAVAPVVVPPPPSVTLPLWPAAANPKESPSCTGQGCADRFRDGQSVGYELLQWGVTNQADPNRRNNLSAVPGARTDPTAQNPTGRMTTRDFLPGGATESELNAGMNMQNLTDLMGIASEARRKVNQTGCRVTMFSPSTSGFVALEARAYQTRMQLLSPATPTNVAKFATVRVGSLQYSQPLTFAAPLFGATQRPKIQTIAAASLAQDGIEVELTFHALDFVNDSAFVPWRVSVTNAVAQIATVGTVADNFTVRGTLQSIPASGASLVADVYVADRRYYAPHTQPNGVCQPDPPSCNLVASDSTVVSTCAGSPFSGLQTIFNPTGGGKQTTTDAHQTLSASVAANRTVLAGVNPDDYADAVLPGSRNTLAGSPPIVQQEPGKYRPFSFTVNELFSGCTEVKSTTLPDSSSSTRRTLDVQSCVAHLNPATPRTCTGTRALGFTPLGNYQLAEYTYRHTTKSQSCPSGTTYNADVPAAPSAIQLRNMRYDTCPVSAPYYIGGVLPDGITPLPVSGESRTASADGNSWGSWTPFSSSSTSCSADPVQAISPTPANPPSTQIYGLPSLAYCMPGRTPSNGMNATAVPLPFTGTLNFSIRTVGESQLVYEPEDPAPYTPGSFDNWQINYTRAQLDPHLNFPHNLTVTAGSGSVSGLNVTTYGSANDGWTITGTVNAVNANSIRFASDIKYVAANDTVGCGEYMGMLGDKVCTLPPPGKMTCTDDRGSMTTVNGVTFGVTGPLTGVTAFMKPWGSPVTAVVGPDGPTSVAGGPAETYVSEPLCFAVTGPQLNCSIPGSNSQNWTNHFPNEQRLQGYIDNCDTRPRNSIPATTTPLLVDPACRFIGPGNCVAGAAGAISGICYQREVLFDCGTTQTVGNGPTEGSTQLEQVCSSALRCIGTECHRPVSETSQDFAAIASTGEIINAIRHHTVCAETGEAPTSQSQSCTPILFGGIEKKCLSPLTAEIGVGQNCCKMADEMAAGMGIGKYVTMLTLVWRLKDTQFAQQTLQQLGNLSGVTAAYGNVSQTVAATLKPITDSFASMMRSMGFSPTNPAVVAKDVGLAAPGSLANPLTEISNLIESKITEMLGSIFEALGIGASTAASSQLAKEFLGKVNNVLFWYGVAQLIGSLIYSCNAAQLTPGLGLARKGGNCHFIGTRTSRSVGALERFSVYCCYSSPLARIMQENFRNGMEGSQSYGTNIIGWTKAPFYGQGLFGGWGTASSPKCDGITPEQMLQVNWSRVDLSEWINALKDNGLLPSTATEMNKRYGLSANGANTAFPSLGPSGADTPQPGPDAPMDKPKAMQAFMTKYGGTMNGVIDTLAPQSVCYTDPKYMAWYASPGPQSVTDIIEDLGGTGTYQSCGAGCVDVTLGTAQDDYFHDTCTRVYQQQQAFRINRPDYILSAQITQAVWDDHMQISVDSNPVYTSPSWYLTPPFGGSVCELAKSWQLNAASPCVRSGCTIVSNSVPSIDITAQMQGAQPGGIVRTNTAVIVGGGGEGFAKMRILYKPPGPPPPLPTDPADPNYRHCYSPDGTDR